MRKKTGLFILLGIVTACVLGATLFFVTQSIAVAEKEQVYFDVYREQAEEYVRSNPEILQRYGADIRVTFDDSVRYSQSGQTGFLDRIIALFAPDVPDTIEEFNGKTDMISFRVHINGDEYDITFEKNDGGALAVSTLTAVEK